ncbi:hypothetical protein J6590_008824 [Homalodisca vitripennis]|nr:hypothetical protein J6590_008824 [Homalodisca vitripennis]
MAQKMEEIIETRARRLMVLLGQEETERALRQINGSVSRVSRAYSAREPLKAVIITGLRQPALCAGFGDNLGAQED